MKEFRKFRFTILNGERFEILASTAALEYMEKNLRAFMTELTEIKDEYESKYKCKLDLRASQN